MIDRIVSALAAALAGDEPGVPAPAATPVPPAIVRPAEAPAPPPPAPLAVKQVAPPPPPASPPATIWRLADATGQVWEHSDPAVLSAFVADRNRYRLTPRYFAPAPAYRAGRCGPSGCR